MRSIYIYIYIYIFFNNINCTILYNSGKIFTYFSYLNQNNNVFVYVLHPYITVLVDWA